MKFWIILLAALFLLSFVLTYLIRVWALKYKIIDIPNRRSSHTSPTPRGGGLAIITCWYIGITILFFNELINDRLYYAFISGSLLAIISLLDDLVSIKPLVRLLAQFITAALAVFFLEGFDVIEIYKWNIASDIILILFALLAITWFINLYNFLDGIDGYASIEAICIAIVLFMFTGNNAALILIASIAGFLFWNRPKAKIFMGDVGSTQLGYIIIVLGIHLHNDGQFNFINWILLSSPFWFDATLTLFRRWRNGETLSQAHKKHVYQRLVQAGYNHLQVNMILIGLNIYIAVNLLLISRFNYLIIPLFLTTIIILYLLTRIVDRKVPF